MMEVLVVKSNLASASPEKCSICSPDSVAWHKSCRQSDEEPPADDGKKNSMAIGPVEKLEIASSSVSLLLRELPELKPGWPLLRRAIISNRSSSYNSQVRQISVVQWVMRLPSRYCLFIEHSTRKDSDPNHDQDKSSKLDGETGAIVPVGNESVSVPSCPDRVPRSLPEELEGLHEKYSATCRLFMEMVLHLCCESCDCSFQVIDACAKGNLGRFINHSCDPNCRTEKWMVNGEVCIGLFSLRDIKKGEEATFDYNFVRVFGAAAKKCVCGSANCRGYIGGDLTNSEVIAQDDSDDEYKEPVMTCEDGEMSEDWNDIINYAHDREDEIANKPSQNIYSMKNFIGTVGESITTSHTTEPSPKKVEGVNSGHAAEIRVGDGVGVYDSIDNSSTADVVEKLNNKTTGESLKGSTPAGLTVECEGIQSQIHKSSQVVDNNLQSDGIVNKTMSSAHESAISVSRRKSLSGKVQFKRNLKYATVEVRDGLAKSNSLTKTNHSLSSIKKGKPKFNALKDRVSPDVDQLSAELHKSKKLPKLPINHHFEAVEEKLNELLDPEGGISKRKDASKGYLKLLFLTAATGNNGHGEAIQSNRDLSMILDALLKTKSRTVLVDIINKNGSQMLHNIMKRYRKEFTKTPILRKLLKVLEYLATREILTLEHISGGPPCPGVERFIKLHETSGISGFLDP